MKPLVLILSLIIFSACSSTKETTSISPPELLYQHPLPVFPRLLTTSQLRIALKIFIETDGTVHDVEFMNSSGSADWDSTAVSAIRKWKYSPAKYEGKPISIWLRQTAIVKFSDPQNILLAEIILNNLEEADSAFALLEEGVDFFEVVRKYSKADSRSNNGSLGIVNIQIFPEQIKNIILRLDQGDYTAPVKYGEQFAIYKRLKE